MPCVKDAVRPATNRPPSGAERDGGRRCHLGAGDGCHHLARQPEGEVGVAIGVRRSTENSW